MSRFLITGVTGFTGRYLAPALAAAGHEVHGTLFGDPGPKVAGVAQLHRLDLRDADAVSDLVSTVEPEAVVHLAAISYVAHSNLAEMYQANILGTRNLLHAIASRPKPSQSVLVASSANIYGNARAGVLDEQVPPAPANDYGLTKAASEMVAAVYAPRVPVTIVRPFNYTGRGQSERFLIPKIVAHARRREPSIELGNLEIERDFSDVRAVVDAYVRLLATPSATGGTFNVCSGRAVSIREILDLVRQISGYDLQVRVNPSLVRPDEVKTLRGSAKRLESAIGPLDVPPLEETLRWMLEE